MQCKKCEASVRMLFSGLCAICYREEAKDPVQRKARKLETFGAIYGGSLKDLRPNIDPTETSGSEKCSIRMNDSIYEISKKIV